MGGTPVPPPPLFEYAPKPATRRATPVERGARSGSQRRVRGDLHVGRGIGHLVALDRRAGPFVAKSGAQIAPKNVVVFPVVYGGAGSARSAPRRSWSGRVR